MSDPINLPPAETSVASTVESNQQQTESPTITAAGYSQANSSSEVKAEASSSLSLNIEDTKQTNNQTASSYLNNSLIQRLNAFNNSLSSNFGVMDKYQNNILDLAQDGALLIMTIKNFLHGFKMVGAMNNTIADNHAKSTITSKETKRDEVNQTIKNSKANITELQQQNQLYKQQFSSTNTELNLEVNKLNSQLKQVDSQDNNPAPNINEQDILELQNKINLLIKESNDIQTLITNTEQQLTEAIDDKAQQLLLREGLEKFITYVQNSVINIPELVKKVIVNSGYDYQSLMKLIISISETSKENIKAEEEIVKKRNHNEKLIAAENQKTNYAENLLSTKFLSRLINTFSLNRGPAIAGSEHNMPHPENLQAPVALVLTANINDKKFPDLGHKQPYLGDSLSLDGADNPLAYGMIMLAYQMQALHKNMATSNNIATAEQQEINSMQALFNLQNEVDSLVFNSLNQAAVSQVSQRQAV